MTIAKRIYRCILPAKTRQRINQAYTGWIDKVAEPVIENGYQRVHAYAHRKAEAEARGLPFDEPSPMEIRGEAVGISRGLKWAKQRAKANAKGHYFDTPPPEAIVPTDGVSVKHPDTIIGENRGIAKAIAWADRKDEARSRRLPFKEPKPKAPSIGPVIPDTPECQYEGTDSSCPALDSVNYASDFNRGVKEVLDWLQRKSEAQAQGIPFTEPPPSPSGLQQ